MDHHALVSPCIDMLNQLYTSGNSGKVYIVVIWEFFLKLHHLWCTALKVTIYLKVVLLTKDKWQNLDVTQKMFGLTFQL